MVLRPDELNYEDYFSAEEIELMEMHPVLDTLASPEMSNIRQDLGFGAYDSRGAAFDENEGYMLGLAYGDMIDGKYIIGRDHRRNSEAIKNALIQGLEEQDAEVVDIGLAPTDMVSYAVQSTESDAGVAVTASHMPPEYHGLKPLNSEGRIFDGSELDIATENFLGNQLTRSTYVHKDENSFGKTYDKYLDALVSRYQEIFENDLSGIRVGVDPGHGMASLTLPTVFEQLGLEEGEDLYFINDELDSDFSNRNPDPTEDSLKDLSNLVLEEELDIGIALDGDADRAVYINEEGEKVPGDHALAILGRKYLETVDEETSIACSVNTSALVQEYINSQGGVIDYEPVGAVFTAKAALKDNTPITAFGGQPNGHYLDPEFTPYDSGTLFAAIMPGIIKEERSSDQKKTLRNLQNELPEYIISRKNIEAQQKATTIERMENALDETIFAENDIIKGMKNGQVITMRPSGTEPVVRIMAETPDPAKTIQDIQENRESMEVFRD